MKCVIAIYEFKDYRTTTSIWEINREVIFNGYQIRSSLLVCPACCQIWAKLSIEGQALHVPRMVSCVQCGVYSVLHKIPGSLLDNHDSNELTDWLLLEALPADLLRREYDLHIQQFEKVSNEPAKYDDLDPSIFRRLSTAGSEHPT